MSHRTAESRAGLLYGIAAYGFWGIVPLYFALLRDKVTALEFLGHRICWSTLLLGGLITLLGAWGRCRRCLIEPRTRRTLILTSLLIGVNWYPNKNFRFVVDYERTWYRLGAKDGDRVPENSVVGRVQTVF